MRRALEGVRKEDMYLATRIKWQRYGADVLPAWVADMDFPVAPPIQRVLEEHVARSDLGYHALPVPGRLLEVFVARMSRLFGWQIETHQLWGLVNVVQAIDAAVMLHSEPGDGVVLQTPIYAPFHRAVDSSGRRRIDCPLVRGDERYEVDFDRLRASIDERTRVFLLCSPHNPCGRVWQRGELETLAEIVLEHDLVVVSDEIWSEITYPGHEHLPFASLAPEIAARTITLTSATKAFNLAGLPFALAIFGSKEVKAPFKTLPPHLLGHGGMLGTQAAMTAWADGDLWIEQVRLYLDENRRFVGDFLKNHLPGATWRAPEATYLAWIDLNEYGLGDDPAAQLLETARVALSPGPDFGPPGAGFVRLNFATSRTILEEVLERLASQLHHAR